MAFLFIGKRCLSRQVQNIESLCIGQGTEPNNEFTKLGFIQSLLVLPEAVAPL